jgi:hypothetical protein
MPQTKEEAVQMKNKMKASRKLMASRIGKNRQAQSPGVYTRLNQNQEEVQLSNRARRRAIISMERRLSKRRAPAPLPAGTAEVNAEVKL